MKKTSIRTDIIDALSLPDLCRFCQMDEAWAIELVELGVLDPSGNHAGDWQFVGANVVRAKKAGRLRRDLGINGVGVALVLELLEEREHLRQQLARLGVVDR